MPPVSPTAIPGSIALRLLGTAPDRLRPRYLPLSQRARRRVITALLVVSDGLMLGLAFALAYVIRFQLLPYFARYTLGDREPSIPSPDE